MSKKYGLYSGKYKELHNGFKLIIAKEDYRGWGNGSASKNISRDELINVFISVQNAYNKARNPNNYEREIIKEIETNHKNSNLSKKELGKLIYSWMEFNGHAIFCKYSDIEVKQAEDAAIKRINNRRKRTRHLAHIENRFSKAKTDLHKHSMEELKCCFAKVAFSCGAITLMSGAVYAYGDNAGMTAVKYITAAALASGVGAVFEHSSQKKAAENSEIASKELDKVKVMAKNQGVRLPDSKSFKQAISMFFKKDILGLQNTK